ncbi:hypothetical protein BDY21DRAFT_348135 [Lineolata rhizophorae]|uniref:Uncharacterized protein n=1 Tax=Lineolata rhizophorae TaxID=578093 RepID=A0A6A6NWR3_9PEZI|nr:hypothetical protein BDY21DRAFT_348135 [Lineolata rhizophorae]
MRSRSRYHAARMARRSDNQWPHSAKSCRTKKLISSSERQAEPHRSREKSSRLMLNAGVCPSALPLPRRPIRHSRRFAQTSAKTDVYIRTLPSFNLFLDFSPLHHSGCFSLASPYPFPPLWAPLPQHSTNQHASNSPVCQGDSTRHPDKPSPPRSPSLSPPHRRIPTTGQATVDVSPERSNVSRPGACTWKCSAGRLERLNFADGPTSLRLRHCHGPRTP